MQLWEKPRQIHVSIKSLLDPNHFQYDFKFCPFLGEIHMITGAICWAVVGWKAMTTAFHFVPITIYVTLSKPVGYRTDACVKSQRLSQTLHEFKPDRIPAWRKGSRTKSPTTQKLFATDTFWIRENHFSPIDRVLSTTFQGRLHGSGEVGQHKTVCVCVWGGVV